MKQHSISNWRWSLISQLIQYSRAWGSSRDFPDSGLLLTEMLLIQGFLGEFYGHSHIFVHRYEIAQITTDMSRLA